MTTLPIIKATNVTTFRNSIKKQLDLVTNENVSLIVTRNDDKNVVVLSVKEYESLIKEINNLSYELKMLRSYEQLREGNVVVKTLDELKSYEK